MVTQRYRPLPQEQGRVASSTVAGFVLDVADLFAAVRAQVALLNDADPDAVPWRSPVAHRGGLGLRDRIGNGGAVPRHAAGVASASGAVSAPAGTWSAATSRQTVPAGLSRGS